jgi:hypothetical protein
LILFDFAGHPAQRKSRSVAFSSIRPKKKEDLPTFGKPRRSHIMLYFDSVQAHQSSRGFLGCLGVRGANVLHRGID